MFINFRNIQARIFRDNRFLQQINSGLYSFNIQKVLNVAGDPCHPIPTKPIRTGSIEETWIWRREFCVRVELPYKLLPLTIKPVSTVTPSLKNLFCQILDPSNIILLFINHFRSRCLNFLFEKKYPILSLQEYQFYIFPLNRGLRSPT